MSAPTFDNSYARLPERFYTKLPPSPVAAPDLIRLNAGLAAQMGLDSTWLNGADGLAMLSGNQMPDGADPLAQAYAGHQFGGWSPQLGDGRANLLGEISHDGQHFDIQLKGSGPTPYSRMGDGRAAIGPVLREYIVSEAMHALGVPTTRALAAMRTGEAVMRETPLPGAILTRVAPSHIRVGTFQFFAARDDQDGVRELLAFAIARHYPHLSSDDALGFLKAVAQAQAVLVAKWMGLGFIHGVMNTDNCHVGGITIDYGPCAYMDAYHPATVFSSIDQYARYAYQAQPEILVWNLAQLATSLLPMIDADRDRAVGAAQGVLSDFGDQYTAAWKEVFFAKVGLADGDEKDIAMIQDFLVRMADNQADFTQTFRLLAEDGPARDQFVDPTVFDTWHKAWSERITDDPYARMRQANPAIIPRNHRVEEAIQAGQKADFGPFHRLVDALENPFEPDAQYDDLRRPPEASEAVLQTFCGT